VRLVRYAGGRGRGRMECTVLEWWKSRGSAIVLHTVDV
jgi:hypothetical protein